MGLKDSKCFLDSLNFYSREMIRLTWCSLIWLKVAILTTGKTDSGLSSDTAVTRKQFWPSTWTDRSPWQDFVARQMYTTLDQVRFEVHLDFRTVFSLRLSNVFWSFPAKGAPEGNNIQKWLCHRTGYLSGCAQHSQTQAENMQVKLIHYACAHI